MIKLAPSSAKPPNMPPNVRKKNIEKMAIGMNIVDNANAPNDSVTPIVIADATRPMMMGPAPQRGSRAASSDHVIQAHVRADKPDPNKHK
eukprot:365377-Chlamydomonas_euryale.AAC.46